MCQAQDGQERPAMAASALLRHNALYIANSFVLPMAAITAQTAVFHAMHRCSQMMSGVFEAYDGQEWPSTATSTVLFDNAIDIL